MRDLLTGIVLGALEGAVFVGFLNIFDRISDGDKFEFEFVPDAVIPFLLFAAVSVVFRFIGGFIRRRQAKRDKESN